VNESRKESIIYLTTYIDRNLSSNLGLPYSPAGLKKKNYLLELLDDYNRLVVSTPMFSKIKGRFYKLFVVKKERNLTIIFPTFTTIPILNYLLNPIFTFVIIKKLLKKYKVAFFVTYNCSFENVIPLYFLYKTDNHINVICQYEDGFIMYKKGFKKFLYKLAHKLAYKMTRGVIINSMNMLNIFPKENYFLFYGNVENKEYSLENLENDALEKVKILFASTLDKLRGVSLLIEFLKKCDDKELMNRLHIIITGKGTRKTIEKLKDTIIEYNERGGTAEYKGFVDNNTLKMLYKNADVFLSLQDPSSPFSKYCFPSKIFEYYRFNKPIITTKVSDLENSCFYNLIFIDYTYKSFYNVLKDVSFNIRKYKESNKSNFSFLLERYTKDVNKRQFKEFLKKTKKGEKNEKDKRNRRLSSTA